MTRSSDSRRARIGSDHWVREAERFVGSHRYENAIEALLRAARLAPHDPTILYNLGTVYLAERRLSEAIAWLRRSIALRPNSARAHLILGLALQQNGEDEECALSAYRRAIELEPAQTAEVHALVADLLWDNGRREDAVRSYERAAAAAPETTFGLLCLAKVLTAQHRPAAAIERLMQLVVRDPSSSDALLTLGHALAEVGRFDEAIASFERAVALSPELAGAHHGLVSSKRLTESDRPWMTRILSQLERPDNGVRQKMTYHFAAGKALDDLGDYAGAIQHFDAANQLRRRLGRPLDREGFAELIGALSATFTPEYFRSHTPRDPAETPLLVLGLPRSGTTLIERMLSAHPNIAGGGEIVFWNDVGADWLRTPPDGRGETEQRLRTGYLRVLRNVSPDARRVTDKNTFNWLWVGLVHLLFPNARIIHCRRHPIDTCLSIYTTALAYNWGFASDRGDLAAYYRLYLRMVAYWRKVLPPDRWLDVDYEEVTAATEPVARRLLAFAGLAWDPACSRPEQNPDPVRTASRWQSRQAIYRTSVGRWKSYEPWLGELRELEEIGRGQLTKSSW
jgi:tetratricopeptide (TPR) repeat protein